jgi:hypothetical protein
MKTYSWMVLSLALTCPAVSLAAVPAGAGQPVWPAGAQKKDDPRVLAFYDGQCARYADQNGLSGEKRDAFMSSCLASIPAVFPVGYAEGGGGGGE